MVIGVTSAVGRDRGLAHGTLRVVAEEQSGVLRGAALLVCSMAWTQAAALPDASAGKTTHHGKPPSCEAEVHQNEAYESVSPKQREASRKASRRGQQKIDLERTHQIQQALIKQHYLSGEPSGKWDASTEAALRKFQADNGWQNKTVPDSRALIKLGLGPNHDHLLNPESAMTSTPRLPPRPRPDSRGPRARGAG